MRTLSLYSAYVALAGSSCLATVPASAQDYPSRNVTIVLPLAAGTGMDSIARLYSSHLQSALGKPVVVENQPGAALTLATANVARAPADGHTLLVGTSGPFAIQPVVFKKVNYDPTKDFVPVAFYAKSPFILVVDPKLPIKNVSDLINHSKNRATPLTYSSPGVAGPPHLAMELMKQRLEVNLTHVPYRSSPQAISDIVAGHVNASFAEAGISVPLITDGKLRALALSSATRLGSIPDVPTFAEAANAPDFEVVSWHILFAPAETPKAIVDTLHKEMKRITTAPAFMQQISAMGLMPVASPSVDDMRHYIRSEQEKWGALVRRLGLDGSQ